MAYIVCSRGRPIGVTSLDFVRIHDRYRCGWLEPNAEGERALEVVSAVVPAMRAFLGRDDRVSALPGSPPLADRRSTAFADISEALHHVDALDLSLHDADGVRIPTTMVVVQDCDQLLALAHDDSLDSDYPGDDGLLEPWDVDFDDRDDAASVSDMIEEMTGSDDPWTPEDEQEAMPRYQIYVRLAKGVALP